MPGLRGGNGAHCSEISNMYGIFSPPKLAWPAYLCCATRCKCPKHGSTPPPLGAPEIYHLSATEMSAAD